MRRGALGLLTLVAAASAHAQTGRAARLAVLADTAAAVPGQRVHVAVAVDHAPGTQTVFPAVPAALPEAEPGLSFGDAEALAVRRLPPRVRGRVRTDSAVYSVAVFAVDTARIGPVTVGLVTRGDTLWQPTGVARLPMRRLAAADAALPPPRPPEPFPSPVPHGVALGALLAGGLGWGAWRGRRGRAARPAAAAPLAPYPAALARLDALDAETPATPAAAEALVDALKDTLRVYLGRRLHLPADRLTTDELTARLTHLPPEAQAAVGHVLRTADLVDFAAWRPGSDVVAEARARTRDAVERVEAAVCAAEPAASPVAP